jgi:hypothetical protein
MTGSYLPIPSNPDVGLHDESRLEQRSDLHAGYPRAFRGGIGKIGSLFLHAFRYHEFG